MFVSGEATVEPETDMKTYEDKFLEKQADGKWAPVIKSKLTDGFESFALTKIVIPVTLLTGEPATVYIDNQSKKEALQSAMKESGLNLNAGTGIRMIRGENKGKLYTWTIKLAAPKA
jgi:hypothetical protein